MSNKSFTDELNILLQSNARAIWIVTDEENSCKKAITELMSNYTGKSCNVIEWSIANGSRTLGIKGISVTSDYLLANKDLNKFFISVVNANNGLELSEEKHCQIYILNDFNAVIENPVSQRHVKDFMNDTNSKHKKLIVISPFLQIPDDLSKDFKVLEYSTPNKEEIVNYVKLVIPKDKLSDNVTYDIIADAFIGMTKREVAISSKELCLRFDKIPLDFLMNKKIENIKKSGLLDFTIPKKTLNDVGGNENIKKWLISQKNAFCEEARKFGVETPKGYVSVGIAGCGKTILAEAFAGTMGYPLIQLPMGKIMNSRVGETERQISAALKTVKECAPCVLLLDEVEKVLGGFASSNKSDSGILSRMVQQLLAFMDDNESGVYVIMTSNDISQLPPELTRSGRLDTQWFFGLPTPSDRKQIFNIHFNRRGKEIPDFILDEVVKNTENFTGAEIEQVVKNSIKIAFNRYLEDNDSHITIEDIEQGINEVVPVFESSKEKIVALKNYFKNRARTATKIQEIEKEDEDEFTFAF